MKIGIWHEAVVVCGLQGGVLGKLELLFDLITDAGIGEVLFLDKCSALLCLPCSAS
ncbi:MAG: hypothetical protein LBL39_05390 [Planctomycetaceae bacterium]|nr:hypothetical protein [Planctomycetaceae bacterium]